METKIDMVKKIEKLQMYIFIGYINNVINNDISEEQRSGHSIMPVLMPSGIMSKRNGKLLLG